jgi:hypothetical protein
MRDNKKVMIKVRKKFKRLIRRIRSKKNRRVAAFCLIAASLLIVALYITTMPKRIEPTAYTPLLSVIAKGESLGNYNAYFNNPNNSSLKLTEMSVAEVLAWQDEYIAAGNASSAVGRYQIIQPTLKGLITELKINPSQMFDEQLQDKLAIALIERRGAIDFVNNKISTEQFAANLAKEWAALPSVQGDRPTESFYAGDGLNQSRVSTEEVFEALTDLTK